MLSPFWLWLILAGVLLIFEMLTVSTYALWVAIGSAVTAVVCLFLPGASLASQVIIFAIASAAGLLVGAAYFKSSQVHTTDSSMLNQRGNQYIGQVYTLEENIIDGRAHLRISDTVWQIESKDDLTSGTKVKVIAVDGNRLVVELV